MPPQATGFRYTPSSYLLRTRDENRPWSASSSSSPEDEDIALDELDEIAMRQEDRPIRKETSIDEHFQNRVNRRKQAYRKIIQGQVEIEPDEPLDNEKVDLHLSDSAINTTSNSNKSQSSEYTAREARQRRLSYSGPSAVAVGETFTQRKKTEAARLRNLRAQRLRESLKASTEEEDAMEALKVRRQKLAERDRLVAEQEEKARLESEKQRRALEAERRKLEEEKRAFEEAKRQAAAELERRIEMERRLEAERQKELHRIEEAKRKEETERRRKLEEQEQSRDGSNETSIESDRRPRRAIRRRQQAEPEMELTMFEELQELIRDSGVIKVCVASCFGDEEDLKSNDLIDEKRTYRRKFDGDI